MKTAGERYCCNNNIGRIKAWKQIKGGTRNIEALLDSKFLGVMTHEEWDGLITSWYGYRLMEISLRTRLW